MGRHVTDQKTSQVHAAHCKADHEEKVALEGDVEPGEIFLLKQI